MKNILYKILFAVMMISCSEEVLDKKPLDLITDIDVWQDEVLMDSYLTNAYLKMYILKNETPYSSTAGSTAVDWFNGEDWNGPFIVNEVSDEAMGNWIVGQSRKVKTQGLTINGGILEWWEHAYRVNRILNEFIEKVPSSPASDEFKMMKVAEARFLRAFNYFSMVKRYGGVPLITETQNINDSDEEIYRARNKEQEIYDFIISEMDAIASNLPERNSGNYEYGRPSRHTAFALQCRAALYAGSIAQYGSVQLNGIVGIPSSDAVGYYQTAFDAAEEIMTSGLYQLYDVDTDKIENFKNVFLVKDNPEVIWAERHDYVQRNQGGNGWVWDFFQCPRPHAWNAGNQNAPYLEMAEEFEYVDGTPGALDRVAIQNGLHTIDEVWGNRDPRFYATIYTQGTPWKGVDIDWYNGLILPDLTIITSGSYEGVLAQGYHSRNGTGFGVMKYLEEDKSNLGERATSGTDWQIFRYGEILLNYAEAAFELGRPNDALDAINALRSRAGIVTIGSVDRDQIRHERKVELAFEGHRYWDVRRWRVATSLLSVERSGISYKLDFNTRDFKIVINPNIETNASIVPFTEANYYLPVTLTRTSNNPNLIENPGYQ
ncbi:MAG: RagB/SusD family nutrient uptake outer membrane protein [Phycisphaeraceae bacterium]|nr:RagB/SusD family nutrient uptake outer membrane protein [Phycisphaeraceae bacterium]